MALLTLLVATAVGCSGFIATPLKTMMGWLVCGGESEEEQRLLREVSSLRGSLQNISMADQFPAWAKLQRQITARTQAYQTKSSERCSSEQLLRTVCSVVVDAVLAVLCLWYMWCSVGSAVVQFPVHDSAPYLLAPLTTVLAMPGCSEGQVSVMVWIACVRSVATRVSSTLVGPKPASGGLGALLPLLTQLLHR